MNLQNARLGMVIVDLQNDFLAPDGAYARGNTLSAEAVQLPARMAPVARAIKAANAAGQSLPSNVAALVL